jgi:hypothetical protein
MPPGGTTRHVNEDHIAEIYKAARIAALTRGQRDQSEANPAQPGAVARLHKERASAKTLSLKP